MANPVQTVAAAHTPGAQTLTFAAAPQGGNLVTVIVEDGAAAGPAATISGLGATWTAVIDTGSGHTDHGYIFAAIVPLGNSLTSITITPATGGCTCSAQEWSGYGLKTDGTNFTPSSGTTVTSVSTGSITTTQEDLIIAFVGKNNIEAITAPGAPWNALDAFNSGSPVLYTLWQDGAPGSYSATFSWTTLSQPSAGIAAFIKLDDGGLGVSGRRVTLPPFGKLVIAQASNLDDEFMAALGDDAGIARMPRMRPFQAARLAAGAEPFAAPPPEDNPAWPLRVRFKPFRQGPAGNVQEPYVAPITDEDWPRPQFVKLRGLRPGRPGDAQEPFAAPITDEDFARPSFVKLRGLRPGRPGDEQQPLATPVTDEAQPPARVTMRGFRRPYQSSDESPALATAEDNASPLRRLIRGLRVNRPGDEQEPLVAPVTDESNSPPRTPLRAFRRPYQTSDEQPALAAIEDNAAPARRLMRGLRVNRPGDEQQPFAAPVTDEDFPRPPFVKLRGLRPGRPGDEQQPLATPVTDEAQPPARVTMRGFRLTERAVGRAEEPIAALADDGIAPVRPARITALRRVASAVEDPAYADETTAPLRPPRPFAALRLTERASGRGEEPLAAAADNPAAPPPRIARFRQSDGGRVSASEPIIAAGEEPGITVMSRRLWRWVWRRARELAEELGIAPPQAPRIVFRATLDQPIIAAAASDPAMRFGNTLDPPIVGKATL